MVERAHAQGLSATGIGAKRTPTGGGRRKDAGRMQIGRRLYAHAIAAHIAHKLDDLAIGDTHASGGIGIHLNGIQVRSSLGGTLGRKPSRGMRLKGTVAANEAKHPRARLHHRRDPVGHTTELEAKVKAGEQISLVDLANAVKADKERGKGAKPEKKPSIRAQLRADKEKAQKKNAKQKSQDLERS